MRRWSTAKRPLGISEFGVLLGPPKPTAHRIVRMLEGEGLLQREPGSSRYVPGVRLERLGLDIVAARRRGRRGMRFWNCSHSKSARPAISASWPAATWFISTASSWRGRSGSSIRTRFARPAPLHIDGQAVSQHAARAQGARRCVRSRFTATPKTPLPRSAAWNRNWRRFYQRKFPPTTRNFWRGWCASPFRFTARRTSPVAALAVSAPLARMSACDRAVRTFRLAAVRRQQPGCDNRAGWKFERRGNL